MNTKTNSPTPTQRVIAAIPPAYGEPIDGFPDTGRYTLKPSQRRGYAEAHRELVHAFEREKSEALAQEASQSALLAEVREVLPTLLNLAKLGIHPKLEQSHPEERPGHEDALVSLVQQGDDLLARMEGR